MLPAGVVLALLLSAAPAMADLDIPRAAPTVPDMASPHMQDPTLWTQTIYGDVPQDAGTHRMVVSCSGDALLYSLALYVPGEGNRYHIAADSIRLNGMALGHPGYSGEGDLRTDLLQGGPITLEGGTLPLVLPGHGSLMVPVVVTGEGAAVRAVVDMSYVSGRQTTCSLDSFEPEMVGAFFPDDAFGNVMQASVGVGTIYFNAYLEGTGAGWRLEPEVRTTNDVVAVIEDLQDAGIRTHLGFPASSGLEALAAGYPDHLAVSCCATVGSLDADDRIFRTAPSDTQMGIQLARLMQHNGIDVLLPVWHTYDSWETGYRNSVAGAFSDLGGTVDDGVAVEDGKYIVEDGEDTDRVAARVVERIASLSEAHGADRVAVFVAIYEEAALLKAISQYEGARDVRWFGTDYAVGTTLYAGEGSVPEFASAVGYTALQVSVSGSAAGVSPALAEAAGRPTNHDMLAAYESAWILGLAMERTQSSDPGRLAEAIPYVADRYAGTLGPMTMDPNGDLAADAFEVWSVRDGAWALMGVME
jgi:ABC-type branched-subunit amino acid transport system substrate-binding protein